MKRAKKLLGIILTLCMLATMIPMTATNTIAASGSGAVIFVKSGGTGSGASAESPIGSIESAITNIVNAGGGTIVLTGPVQLTSNVVWGKTVDGMRIKITSVYDGVDYRETADAAIVFTKNWINISSKNAFEYENVTLRMNGQFCSFYANGFPIVFGKGIKTEFVEGFDSSKERAYPNIYGGSAHDLSATTNYPAHTSVTVLSGSFWHICGSGKGSAEKQRPSLSATVAVSPDVVCKGNGNFEENSNSAVLGEKVFISVNGENSALSEMKASATNKITVNGNGYISGAGEGKYGIFADSGYAARIGTELVPNSEYLSTEKNFSVAFEKSDLNKKSELEATRPVFPAAFPGEYIKGYDNGDGTFSFRPAGNITIAESATILVRLMTTEEKIAGKYTTEKAKEGDWYYNNIAFLDTYEAFDTFDNFDANRQITRAEFVQLISAFKKLNELGTEITFTDVDKNHKYYSAIRSATMAKLVNGYDNGDGTFSFKPEANITRAEVVTVINRVFDIADLAPIKYKELVPNFSDVDETHWAAFQIIAAAGGKEREKPATVVTGSGEVEFEAFGKVVFVRDGAPEDGDGSSYDKAVTLSKAAGLLKDGGTAVICGPVTLMSNFRFTNGNTENVLFTSVHDGVDYRETKNAAIIFGKNWVNGIPGGPTVFDNIAFISRGSNCSIYCDNKKIVFGKDVVCATEEGAPIAIYGGSANDLSATKNYIGSTDTTIAHDGNYFGNVTIEGGNWSNIYGGGKGTADKPRHSNGSVVNIHRNASIGSVSGNGSNANADPLGLRTIIFNNSFATVLKPDLYDIIVIVSGNAEAEAIDVQKDSVTLKITAGEGLALEGTDADGTLKLDSECYISVTEENGVVKVTKNDKSVAGDLDDTGVELVTDEYLKELDEMEAKRKAEIFATPTTIKPAEGKTAYYVSMSDGDDANDGKSPEKAWKSINKVNTYGAFVPGDVVYFKRGDEWRGKALQAASGVTYTAYGEGAKPILNRSPFDGAKHGTWTPVEGYPNVYKYSELFTLDVGSLAFNERTFIDIYAQKIAFDWKDKTTPIDKATKRVIEDPLAELKNDLDFWHDTKGPNVEITSGGELYLRSDKGNPAERFDNIEFNLRESEIRINGNNITIDNLCIRHAGVHGISSGTTNNLTVTNCVFEWIGGSMQHYTDGSYTRLGNAVEIYGGCDGYLVDNCFIEQVYDAGVTHQVSHTAAGDYIMKNVTYSNNVILRCIYSIEHFNRANEGTTRYLTNITYKNNLCRLAGYCFGNTRPNKGAASHIRSGTIVDTANFVIENNIFDRSINNLFLLGAGGDEEIQWKNNTYIHTHGASYGTMRGVSVVYNSLIGKEVANYFTHPEIGGKYLFIKE